MKWEKYSNRTWKCLCDRLENFEVLESQLRDNQSSSDELYRYRILYCIEIHS